MHPTQAQALEALIAECETANKRAVDEIGMGLIDLNVISRARSAIESLSSTVMDEKGEAETQERKLWVAYRNSDMTEGRGPMVPHSYSESETTARRLAKGISTMGSDGEVKPITLLFHRGQWFAPYGLLQITPPSKEDLSKDAKAAAKELALQKAKALGLSDSEINALKG